MNEMELTLREELFPHWLIYVLLLIITVLTILKNQQEVVFSAIRGAFFKPPSTLTEAKQNLSFRSFTNWIMLFVYFSVGGIAIYMVLLYYEKHSYWMVFLPAIVYFFQLLSLLLVNFISGNYRKVRENIFLLNYIAHVLGIVIIPLLIIWLLNPNLSTFMIGSLVSVVVLFYLIRIVRGMFMAFHDNVLWFYIILYLCGLEIWPMIVGYLLLSLNFIG